MCGILCHKCDCDLNINEIINRGPDCQYKYLNEHNLYFFGSVLHQQGPNIEKQPLKYENSLMLWNGENYTNSFDNDGLKLLKIINYLPEFDALNTFSKTNGPYATICVQKNNVFFGRDVLGRRSLLCGLDDQSCITIISSTIIDGCKHVVKWIELPAVGMFKVLRNDFQLENIELYCYDFYSYSYAASELERLGLSNIKISSKRLETNYKKLHFNIPKIFNTIKDFTEILENLLLSLKTSVHRRVTNIHKQCSQCIQNYGFNQFLQDCTDSKIAILFSGGLDSAVIAALTDRCVPVNESIDLLNVSFSTENKKHGDSADRISGLVCLEELKLINPSRKWNFVQIDVSPAELAYERENRIAKLIQPCDSILDDSIGCALWFAARGKGRIIGESEEYQSPARVILTGIGADELLAGYSRHRCIFELRGYETLNDELEKELQRISSRNMGRDDRVISCHGKEGRFPFLDQDVVSYLQSLPINIRCDLTKERGLGEKMLLRLLARDYLKLTTSWRNHKRAIQFGSQIAKVDKLSKGGKASDKCTRLDLNL